MPADAVLSHRSAAQVWGIWIPRFDGIEMTSPAGPRGSRYTTSVQRRTVVAHRRITPAARRGRPSRAASLRRRSAPGSIWPPYWTCTTSSPPATARCVPARIGRGSARGLPGSVGCAERRRARRVIEHLDARSRSRPESRIRAAIVLAGLPKPRVNRAIYDEHGQWLAEPDLHYREAKLALEYNGADHAGVGRIRKDSVRLLDQQREEWEVRTYTAPHAYARLHEVVDDVTHLLSRRAPELLTAPYLSHRVTDAVIRDGGYAVSDHRGSSLTAAKRHSPPRSVTARAAKRHPATSWSRRRWSRGIPRSPRTRPRGPGRTA